jgi:hypothetical protein
MSIAGYLWGIALLTASVGALALGSGAVIRVALPDWRGALGVLARIALALCWVYAVAYVLGAVGLFRAAWLFAVVVGGALLAWLTLRRRARAPMPVLDDARPQPGRSSSGAGWVAVIAVLVAAVVVGAWLPGTAHAYRHGILEPDSIWYHGQFAARFLQSGWLTRLNPVGVDAVAPYYQANREVLDALLVLPWHRDIALPASNLAYLGVLLLAGWCVGTRWDRGPVALIAAGLVASTPVMILSHPGSLKNDLLGTALVLTAVALFVHGDGRLPAVALAGATLGLAAGTKSNLLVLVVLLAAAGAVALAARSTETLRTWGGRWAAPAVWLGAIALFGCYWYIRNWVRTGSPVPWLDVGVGPVQMSGVTTNAADNVTDQTILNYADHPRLMSNVVYPGIRAALGDAWWAWGLLLVASLALVVVARRRVLVVIAAVGLVGLVSHIVTPLSLMVPPDNPVAFFTFAFNLRYALPAVALVLVAGACATSTQRAQVGFALAGLGLAVAGVFPTTLSLEVSHDADAADRPLTLLLGAVVLVVAGSLAMAMTRRSEDGRTLRAAGLVAAPVVALAVAFPVIDRYEDRRYATPIPKVASEVWPTTSRLTSARIGIATDPVPYPHTGADLSNWVAYVGVTEDGGLLRNPTSCAEWGAVVRSLDLTHVALAPNRIDMLQPLSTDQTEAWTLAIPGAEVMFRDADQVLIELPDDPLPSPPGTCP